MHPSAFAVRWIGFAMLASSFVAAAAMAETAKPDPEVTYNNHCRTCHAVNPGDHRLGPALHGIVGRKAGSVDGFAYSPGFKTTDLVWNEANLDQFIADPNSVFPGSNMATFAGLKNEADRAAIIAYLKTMK